MTLVDAFIVSARCRNKEELREKDIYVKRFLANQIVSHSLTPDKLPLEYWNEAVELFGGKAESTPEGAYEALLNVLGYKREHASAAKE